jgi:hypothetical protein
MKKEWYFTTGGQEVGPVSSFELRQLADSGWITPRTEVRKDGMSRWYTAGKIKGLFPDGVGQTVNNNSSEWPLLEGASTIDQQQHDADRSTAPVSAHDTSAIRLPASKTAATRRVGRTGPAVRYPAMAQLVSLYQFLATICFMSFAILGVLGGVIFAHQGSQGVGIGLGITSIVLGLLVAVNLTSRAEGIKLMLDVEATLRDIRDRLPQIDKQP